MADYAVVEATGAGTLRHATRELRPPAADQVRIRVEACGICRTDSLTVNAPAQAGGAISPGHEIVGMVDAIGDRVTRFAVGDRVGVGFLNGHCGVCEPCRRGRFTSCLDQSHTGLTVDGGYAEVVYARESGVVRIPDSLNSVQAAPLLCAGLTVYNALAGINARPGALVAVQGIGGLGHLAVQYAAAMGYRVAAISRGVDKEAGARELGADHYIDARATNPADALSDLGGASAVLATAVGSGPESSLLPGIEPGGQLVVIGAEGHTMSVSPVHLLFGSRTIRGTLTGSSIDNEDNLAFAARMGIRSHNEVFALSAAGEAYARMDSGAARFRVVLQVSAVPRPAAELHGMSVQG